MSLVCQISGPSNFHTPYRFINRVTMLSSLAWNYSAMDTCAVTISILVAEDDVNDIFFFEEAIRETELSVDLTFFEIGRTLIENLRHSQSHPDLIFFDINMPETDSYEANVEKENPNLHMRREHVKKNFTK